MSALSRRALLRAAAALALPWLEGLAWARRRDGEPGPLRLAYVYVPNGVHGPMWTPAAEGADFDLPPSLAPLAPLRGSFSVLSGLAHDKARANGDGPGDHARACAVFLTGVQPLKGDGSRLRVGVSADQVAARAIGGRTRFRSLELGTEAGRSGGQCDSGYPCAYSSNLSWSTPHTPMTKDVDPQRVFDRLFLDGRGDETPEERAARHARRRSVLDFAREDAARLAGHLGRADREKLDEYLTGVRELERRIDAWGAGGAAGVDPDARPSAPPTDHAEHVRLLFELLVLAFRSDATRIATFLVANEGTNRSYPFLDVPEGHHSLSHHGGDAAKQESISRIDRFHVERFADFLGRLAATREGEATLLERSAVVFGGGLRDGNRHDHHDLPILLAGGGNGTLDPGRHVRFPRDTPLNDLHVALLRRAGVEVDALGDSTGALSGI